MQHRYLTRRSFLSISAVAAMTALSGGLLAGCSSTTASGGDAAPDTIVIACLAREEPDVRFIAEKLADKYTIEPKVFGDNNAINEATLDGSVQANYFQNVPYLTAWNQSKGTNLQTYGDAVFYTIDILVSKKHKTLDDLPEGAKILVANDNANRARELKLLENAGVDETRIRGLFDRVDQFNASVKSEWLTNGFERAVPTDTKYDPYEMQDLWAEKNGDFPGYNCRITAFSLFGEFVTAGADQPETQGEDTLFLDLETLTEDPAVLCGDSTAKFCALFAPVPAADSTDVDEQAKTLQAGWAARGVAFSDSPARLISVVLHDRFSDTENTLFVGHVGVLLPVEDGSFCLIEKVAFQEPYRLVKLQNRAELRDYLMAKYDTSWGQDTTRPFIMENDSLMAE